MTLMVDVYQEETGKISLVNPELTENGRYEALVSNRPENSARSYLSFDREWVKVTDNPLVLRSADFRQLPLKQAVWDRMCEAANSDTLDALFDDIDNLVDSIPKDALRFYRETHLERYDFRLITRDPSN